MTRSKQTKRMLVLLAVVLVVTLLVYLQGQRCGNQAAPGTAALPSTSQSGVLVTVQKRTVDEVLNWPGTVRARTVTGVAPKVMGRVMEIRVVAGDAVTQGTVLVRLDDSELRARLGAAQAALRQARAEAAQAAADFKRLRGLYAKEAATAQDFDAAKARAEASTAQVSQARDRLNEVLALVAETTLRAPFDAVVVARHGEPGDMAVPGRPLLTIQEAGRLRIEVHIPESCARQLAIGTDLRVRADRPARPWVVRVDEIAPAADPETRTVLIKAGLREIPGLQSGRFVWVEQGCGRREALLIPQQALTRIGQLERVQIHLDGATQTRLVRTGKRYGEEVEVLSGLKEGDLLLIGER